VRLLFQNSACQKYYRISLLRELPGILEIRERFAESER